MGFANLQALENRLSSLQSSLSSYKSQLDNQKKRKSNIESIIKDMRSICYNRTDDVNSHLNQMIYSYEDATKGASSPNLLTSTTRADKEKDITTDDNMSNALALLQSELSDVDQKISDLETNIKNTNTQISSCQTSIKTEKHNIAVDYRNQYNNAQARVNAADAALKADPTSARLRQEFNSACQARDSAKANYNKYKWWL